MVTAIELSSKTKDLTTETIQQQEHDSAVLLPAQSDSSSDEEAESPKKSIEGSKTEDSNASSRLRAMASLFDDQDDEEDTTSQTHKPRSRKDGEQHHQASFDIDTSPTKRRRLIASEPHVWDGFVRKGARLKGFLDDALHLVATGFQPNDDDSCIQKRIEEAPTLRQPQGDHAADIAREKTAECMILQKKLKEAEAHAAAMMAANASLREAASSSTERMERTIEALRIAGTNAANARADADAAEACAASMASQLQALRDVVDETKRASSILFKEHEQVSAAARSMEVKLLQKETELARSQKEQRQWMEEREEMKKSSARLQAEQKSLEKKMNLLENDLHKMKHEVEEYHAVEQARKDRSAIVEKELRDARTMLVEATATTAEAECTCAVLKDTISGLETENKTLHETFEKFQDKSREDNSRLNDVLTKVEKEAQSLRVKAASHEEDIQRIRMDRSAIEKQVTQLKQKVVTLERRLKEATSFVPPSPDKETTTRDGGESRRGVSFSVPPLAATTNTTTPAKSKEAMENNKSSNRVTPSAAPKSTTCCICSQLASGFMKSCQCGKPTCDKRAHATCLANNSKMSTLPSSVSHPGTPAPRVPVILCGTFRK